MIRYQWLGPNDVLPTDVRDVNELLRQLTDLPRLLSFRELQEIAEESYLIVARDRNGHIRGMNTLTISRIPTGSVGHLDDVVVDDSLRGQHIGEELVRLLIDRVRRDALVDRLECTCKPARVAANNLYQKLGFQQRGTNCYVLKI